MSLFQVLHYRGRFIEVCKQSNERQTSNKLEILKNNFYMIYTNTHRRLDFKEREQVVT